LEQTNRLALQQTAKPDHGGFIQCHETRIGRPGRQRIQRAEKITQHISRKELNALKKFTTDSSLIFKKGDKTTCIVVKNRKDYVREGLEHLSDDKDI